MRGAKLDSDYRIFFDKSNPQLQAFEQLQNVYSKSDNLIILVSPADGDVFTLRTLQALRANDWGRSAISADALISKRLSWWMYINPLSLIT